MNERIQKLLKQAKRTTAEQYTPGSSEYEREVYVCFAELIVQECREAINRIDVEAPEASIALAMADAAIRDCLGVK